MSDSEFAYVGVKPCGCAPCVIVDSPEYRDDIGNKLQQWVKRGLTVERVTVEEARRRLKTCEHGKNENSHS